MMTLPLTLTRRWAQAARAFNRRALRERVLLIVASAALLVWLMGLAGLHSRWDHLQQQRQQVASTAAALASLQATADQLQTTEQGRQQQARADLAALARQLASADLGAARPAPSVAALPGSSAAPARPELPGLVAPQQMLPLLQELLVHQRGLRLRSLLSLGQTSVGEPAAAAKAVPPSGATLYRHAVQLSLDGSYVDLLAYLQALEALPHQLLWGPMTLDAEHYPALRLTLEVYTLSSQTTWVEL
jgi:MSHA biogenesis protein MshJ